MLTFNSYLLIYFTIQHSSVMGRCILMGKDIHGVLDHGDSSSSKGSEADSQDDTEIYLVISISILLNSLSINVVQRGFAIW